MKVVIFPNFSKYRKKYEKRMRISLKHQSTGLNSNPGKERGGNSRVFAPSVCINYLYNNISIHSSSNENNSFFSTLWRTRSHPQNRKHSTKCRGALNCDIPRMCSFVDYFCVRSPGATYREEQVNFSKVSSWFTDSKMKRGAAKLR